MRTHLLTLLDNAMLADQGLEDIEDPRILLKITVNEPTDEPTHHLYEVSVVPHNEALADMLAKELDALPNLQVGSYELGFRIFGECTRTGPNTSDANRVFQAVRRSMMEPLETLERMLNSLPSVETIETTMGELITCFVLEQIGLGDEPISRPRPVASCPCHIAAAHIASSFAQSLHVTIDVPGQAEIQDVMNQPLVVPTTVPHAHPWYNLCVQLMTVAAGVVTDRVWNETVAAEIKRIEGRTAAMRTAFELAAS